MRQSLLLLSMVIVTLGHLSAQQFTRSVIASDGGTSARNAITLDWTLGELATDDCYVRNGMFTEGFHQPVLNVVQVKPDVFADKDYEAKEELKVDVFPNPVSTKLRVELENNSESKVHTILTDGLGRSIAKKTALEGASTLHFEMKNLPDGFYILSLLNEGGKKLRSYKIIKSQ